ncbi:hypothetical protein NPX79_03550 [Spiroplasma endosymbiont of Anurida maritima]|uniref:hypothetical protein n=1 Tax=Spiroplasma endosymbiont of Anurida maritima TaxID=2967972 RepID=UPI0036D2A0E7
MKKMLYALLSIFIISSSVSLVIGCGNNKQASYTTKTSSKVNETKNIKIVNFSEPWNYNVKGKNLEEWKEIYKTYYIEYKNYLKAFKDIENIKDKASMIEKNVFAAHLTFYKHISNKALRYIYMIENNTNIDHYEKMSFTNDFSLEDLIFLKNNLTKSLKNFSENYQSINWLLKNGNLKTEDITKFKTFLSYFYEQEYDMIKQISLMNID